MSQLNVGALSGIASTVDQINLSTGHTLQIDGNLKFKNYILPLFLQLSLHLNCIHKHKEG